MEAYDRAYICYPTLFLVSAVRLWYVTRRFFNHSPRHLNAYLAKPYGKKNLTIKYMVFRYYSVTAAPLSAYQYLAKPHSKKSRTIMWYRYYCVAYVLLLSWRTFCFYPILYPPYLSRKCVRSTHMVVAVVFIASFTCYPYHTSALKLCCESISRRCVDTINTQVTSAYSDHGLYILICSM